MKRASFLVSTFLFLLSLAFLTWKVEANDLTCCYIIQDLSIEIDDRLVAGPGGFFDLTKEPPEIPPKPVILRSQISDPDPTIKVNFLEQIDPNNGSIDFAFFDEFPEGRGVYLLHKISQPEFLNESPEGRFLIDGNFSLVHSTIPANDLNFTTQESVFVNFGELPAFGSQNAQSGLYRLIVAGYPEFKYIYNDDPVCFDGSLSQQEWDGLCVSIEPYTDQDFKRWYEWRYFTTQEYQGDIPETYEPAQYVKFEFEYVADAEHSVNPVIVIPGIMGSAFKAGQWLIDPQFHIYDNLIETLEANGYVKNTDLFPFGYDWRNSNANTAQKLKEKISAVKATCETAKESNEISTELGITDCSKVDLIAHSMGGLVARSYVQSSDYANDVDQLIFLGTPHHGAPKDYLAWEAGEFPPGTINHFIKSHYEKEAKKMGYKTLFDYIHGWPIYSIKELLPTYDYLDSATSSQILNYPVGYPRNEFLEDLNQGLVGLLESDIDITNIVGNAGSNTISIIRITDSDKLPLWKDGYPENYDKNSGNDSLEYGSGDDTVPNYSSSLGEIFDLEISSSHINLPIEAVEKIYKELTNKEIGTIIKKSIPKRMLYAKIFSPADIVLIDPNGKKVGKNFETGQEINEITGAFYSGFDIDDEYVTIPDPVDGEYRFEIQGTGNGGDFEIQADYIDQNTSVSKNYSNTIKPDEIIKTTLITKSGEDISLDLVIPKIEESVSILASNSSFSSRSGSRHQAAGEVLGASTTLDEQRILQLKLISLLKELISLYMLLLNNSSVNSP